MYALRGERVRVIFVRRLFALVETSLSACREIQRLKHAAVHPSVYIDSTGQFPYA